MPFGAVSVALAAVLLGAVPGTAVAAQGKVLEVQSRDGTLKFKLAGCDQTHYFFFRANDPSRDQAKIIVMASKFSGRPVAVVPACPATGDVQVTQIDLIPY